MLSILGTGWVATRIRSKGWTIAGISVLPTVGTVLMLTVPREQKGVLLFGYYLVCLSQRWTFQNHSLKPRKITDTSTDTSNNRSPP